MFIHTHTHPIQLTVNTYVHGLSFTTENRS